MNLKKDQNQYLQLTKKVLELYVSLENNERKI